MDKSEKLVDPIQSQFFTTNIVGGLTAALVRETIQNSLDAKTDEYDGGGIHYPVEVRFFLSGKTNAIENNKAVEYLNGLLPHLETENNGLQESVKPMLSESMPYLLIEDYNTIGLDGDPLEYEDPSERSKRKNNFFWFWRNVGRSDKGNDGRGRWGLGKAVYPKSSLFHTYFGLTVRESDERALLMGETILKIHKIDGETKYCYPYGYYGCFNDPQDKYFVSPLEESSIIETFIEDFRLNRLDDEGKYYYGLSLVIPFPSEEITKSELIKSAVIQYFYPIIHNQLIVNVEDEQTEDPLVINDDNIDQAIEEIKFSDDDKINVGQLKRLFEFVRWSIKLEEEDYFSLQEPDMEYSPAWYNDWFLNDELKERLKGMIESYEKGSRIAFKVPVKVHIIGKSPKMSWFKVYMEKDEELNAPDCHYIRDGITIVGINPIRRKDVRAIIVIDDPLLSKLLGDAENPAHTEWSKDSPNFFGKYEHGDKVISFVINSLDRLHGWLMKPAEGLDKNILEDIFYIEIEEDTKDGEGDESSGDNGDNTNGSKTPSTKSTSPLIVSKISGGIIIKPNPKVKPPDSVYLKLGYMMARGNPLKRYSELDFDLAKPPIVIEVENANVHKQELNCLDFSITDDDFKVTIKGFDLERDLFIKTDYDD